MTSEEAGRAGISVPEGVVESLQRRIAELTDAVCARDTFIAVAAHELRNPMTPMIGQIDLLLAGLKSGRFSNDQVEQRLERIQSLMVHYIKRSEALLDVTRINSGNLRLSPTSCDLTEILVRVTDSFAGAACHAGTSITIDAPPSLPGAWDRLALEQIIDNLVSNAIKYGSTRPIEAAVVDAGAVVRIQVRDHGVGISAQDRDRIFARFERAVGSDDRHSGFGIGLWVVGQLVEAMHGSIDVQSGSAGTVFTVVLPRNLDTARA